MSKDLDEDLAYRVAFEFLRKYFERGGKQSDDIGSLLGSMSLLQDGDSADPAMLEDWRDAAKVVLSAAASPRGYEQVYLTFSDSADSGAVQLTLVSWKPGLQKVELTKLFSRELNTDLDQAERLTDKLLDDGELTVVVATREVAGRLRAELERLGVIVESHLEN